MVSTTEFDLGRLDVFIAKMLDADREGALAFVAQALADGASLEGVVTGLLAPALNDLGRRWAAAEIGVSESQAAAMIVRAALLRAASPATPNERPVVVVCCPEGEAHELAAEMVAEVLRSLGWPAEMIGATVPAADVRAYLERRKPIALMVSCTTPCGLPGAARMVEAAHDVGVPTLVGGAGFGRDNLRALRLGAAAWAPTVAAAIGVLEGWMTAPPVLPPAAALNNDYLDFEGAVPQIRAGAVAALRRSNLRRRDDIADLGATTEGVELLLRHVEAAVLVDDERVLLDYLSWGSAYLRARNAPTGRLAARLDAVANEIPAAPARASRFVQDGMRHLEWTRRPGSSAGNSAARTRPAAPPVPERAEPSADSRAGREVAQGQVFADLLFLAAMSCHAPMALISVIQSDKNWSTLSYGVDRREALNEPGLFAAVAAGMGPLELADLTAEPRWRNSPLANGPLAVRYVYGIPLRSRSDTVLGVFCVLDRRVRELNRREHQAMDAIARQVTAQIVLWRNTTTPKPQAILAAPGRRFSDRIGMDRPGPDAALVDLLGLRRPGSGVEQHLLRSHEVAVLFDVTERTVINWAASKKLPSLRTAGGHLRFRSEDVLSLLAGRSSPGPDQSN
jgi:MerR family transcriptional regulator, light-induced transcriptional regulator